METMSAIAIGIICLLLVIGVLVDNAGITWTKTTMAVAVIEASDDLWA